ncbi:hypothetical protein DFH07DRAFT_806142 [Mycena maculata]|uniref:RING-type domain-containing protein n=1 Tax=Mycena maculata TaxID=230809 RepID=A0AAD7JR84_9AGAR|nr:hypothetical protein DFH07DRAFT_806142 [Mycena maculata]
MSCARWLALSICGLLVGLVTAQDNNSTTTDNGTSSQSPNTAVAMIVLYVVTGCVSLLFCIIIISGAIRAIRHPERYGPRARNHDGENGWGQSRARGKTYVSLQICWSQLGSGLTRAILDTFPIVQFATAQESDRTPATPTKDIESHPEPGLITDAKNSRPIQSHESENHSSDEHSPRPATPPLPDTERVAETELRSMPGSSSQPESPNGDVIPAAIGRETCPICIVDFEEGDDLRVLPCDGAHCFHQSCVDPWLLELSTMCPICRQDFIALENMISGGTTEDPETNSRNSRLRRFSRYLRFARYRREQDAGEPHSNDGLG